MLFLGAGFLDCFPGVHLSGFAYRSVPMRAGVVDTVLYLELEGGASEA